MNLMLFYFFILPNNVTRHPESILVALSHLPANENWRCGCSTRKKISEKRSKSVPPMSVIEIKKTTSIVVRLGRCRGCTLVDHNDINGPMG